MTWRATYARRFNERTGLDRPQRPKPYVRMTDEQIEMMPEHMRPLAVLCRNMADAFSQIVDLAKARHLPEETS